MLVEPNLADPSGICFKCWSSTYAGYICPACNMSRCVAFQDVSSSKPLPSDLLGRIYIVNTAQPPRPHQLLVLNLDALSDVITRLSAVRQNYDSFPVPEFGVCAALHYVGPKGGFCPICDQMYMDSRLHSVILDDEFASYEFNYRGMSELPGVGDKMYLPAGTATAVEPDFPPIHVGYAELAEIFTDVLEEPIPSTTSAFTNLLVTKNILSYRFEDASQGDPRAPADVSNPQTIAPLA